LIVLDDADSRGGLALLLGLDYSVEMAESGKEVLDCLAHRTYDVILSDLRMPGMSGEDLYRRVARDWPHLVSRFVAAWESLTSICNGR